jgi:hypothetical protein
MTRILVLQGQQFGILHLNTLRSVNSEGITRFNQITAINMNSVSLACKVTDKRLLDPTMMHGATLTFTWGVPQMVWDARAIGLKTMSSSLIHRSLN